LACVHDGCEATTLASWTGTKIILLLKRNYSSNVLKHILLEFGIH
jgi:hypothetical protein